MINLPPPAARLQPRTVEQLDAIRRVREAIGAYPSPVLAERERLRTGATMRITRAARR